jgi:hypothetical protein
MTQEEVNQLAGKIDTLPAGASDSGWWIAAAVVLAIVIWYVWYRR